MKRTLISLFTLMILSLPALAEYPYWGQERTDGDITFTAWRTDNKYMTAIPPYTHLAFSMVTTNQLCDRYRVTVRYRVGENEGMATAEMDSRRLKDLGYVGTDRNPFEQYRVHTGTYIPINAEVISIHLETIQLNVLRAARFE